MRDLKNIWHGCICYEEGIIDQEIFTQDANARTAKLAEGIVGFTGGYSNMGQGWGLSEESLTLFVPGKEAVVHYNADLAKPGAYITVTNPYPEATARWFDTMLQEEVCMTMNSGNDWKYNEEGKIEITAATIKENAPYLKGLAFEYWPKGYYAEHFVMTDTLALRVGYGNAYEEAGVLQKYSDYYMDACKFSGEVNERRNQIVTDINSTMTEYVAEFVMNGVTDEKYNEMLGKLKSIGADEYVEMYQVAFDALEIVIE